MDIYKLIITEDSIKEWKKVMDKASIYVELYCFHNKLKFDHASDFKLVFDDPIVYIQFHYSLDKLNPIKTFSMSIDEFIGYRGNRCKDCNHNYYFFNHICRHDLMNPFRISDENQPACVYFEEVKTCFDCAYYSFYPWDKEHGYCLKHENKNTLGSRKRCYDFKKRDWFKSCIHYEEKDGKSTCRKDNGQVCPTYRTCCYCFEPKSPLK